MDLSKAFDTLNHNLLLGKLKGYEFNENTLTFTQSYYKNRHQQKKVGDKFSKWEKTSTGVPEDSIRGPLFFNILPTTSSFLLKLTLCNQADDNTVNAFNKNSSIAISRLGHDFAI